MSVGWGQDCEENMFWSDCGIPFECNPTCLNPDPSQECIGLCEVGCFCNEGYIFSDDSFNECILIENCPEPSLCDEGYVELWGECYNIEETTDLDLEYSGIIGEIPPEIGNLVNLTNLDLSYNQLNGEIPSEIGNLVNLKWLNLEWSQLSGEIPSEIWDLLNLELLVLEYNQFSGEIPPEIGNLTNLNGLLLGENHFNGIIPPEIGNLVNLINLGLDDNQFSGEIPENICNIYQNLWWFRISGNQLCPPYPDCLTEEDIGYQNTSECSLCDEGYTEIDGECYYQSDLDVVQDFIDSNESLYGYSHLTLTNTINWLNGHLGSFLLYDRGITTIPESIGDLDSLDMIYFFENEIESVPESIGNLINLRFLDLGRNNISNIPDTIWGLENLTTLNFQENQLTSISDEVCNIYSNLEYGPFLSMNQICPPYPECLTEENIGYQDTSECLYIGDECFTDDEVFGYYDCDLCCQTSELIDNWLGDGVCDMYLFSGCSEIFPNFDCYELGYDCGDCESYGGTPWDGSDPLGFCYECIIGDVNNDSILNILDIVSMITLILDGEYHECGDVNSDGNLNILDVITFVNINLSIP